MFHILKDFQKDLAKATWVKVSVRHDRMLSILEEMFPSLQFNGSTYTCQLVLKYLDQWCVDNIKGGWLSQADQGFKTKMLVEYQFHNPKEAMRFKLTWGGE